MVCNCPTNPMHKDTFSPVNNIFYVLKYRLVLRTHPPQTEVASSCGKIEGYPIGGSDSGNKQTIYYNENTLINK